MPPCGTPIGDQHLANLPTQITHAPRGSSKATMLNPRRHERDLQARRGHASASETLDTYGQVWPDNDERTRAAEGVLQNYCGLIAD